MTETHVMIDIETLGLGPKPVVLQIGAVAFDPFTTDLDVNLAFEIQISIDSCLRRGLTVDGSTIAFWFDQLDATRYAVLADPTTIEVALNRFYHWLTLISIDAKLVVWSHGAAFDVPIIEAAYRAVELLPPWDHRAARDTRTLFWLAEARGWKKPVRETGHTARADAIDQARDVQSAMTYLR